MESPIKIAISEDRDEFAFVVNGCPDSLSWLNKKGEPSENEGDVRIAMYFEIVIDETNGKMAVAGDWYNADLVKAVMDFVNGLPFSTRNLLWELANLKTV